MAKGTRKQILDSALSLFRKKGFEKTTMREIAARAGLSLGAAYYYVESKEEIVLAYYAQTQAAHEALLEKSLRGVSGFEARLVHILETKLKLLEDDRAFLGALFRFSAEQGHPLSVFGRATREVRQRAKATLALALEGTALDESLRGPIVDALWLGHLALILHLLHDDSRGLKETRAWARALATTLARALPLLGMPFVHDLLGPLLEPLQLKPRAAGGATARKRVRR